MEKQGFQANPFQNPGVSTALAQGLHIASISSNRFLQSECPDTVASTFNLVPSSHPAPSPAVRLQYGRVPHIATSEIPSVPPQHAIPVPSQSIPLSNPIQSHNPPLNRCFVGRAVCTPGEVNLVLGNPCQIMSTAPDVFTKDPITLPTQGTGKVWFTPAASGISSAASSQGQISINANPTHFSFDGLGTPSRDMKNHPLPNVVLAPGQNLMQTSSTQNSTHDARMLNQTIAYPAPSISSSDPNSKVVTILLANGFTNTGTQQSIIQYAQEPYTALSHPPVDSSKQTNIVASAEKPADRPRLENESHNHQIAKYSNLKSQLNRPTVHHSSLINPTPDSCNANVLFTVSSTSASLDSASVRPTALFTNCFVEKSNFNNFPPRQDQQNPSGHVKNSIRGKKKPPEKSIIAVSDPKKLMENSVPCLTNKDCIPILQKNKARIEDQRPATSLIDRISGPNAVTSTSLPDSNENGKNSGPNIVTSLSDNVGNGRSSCTKVNKETVIDLDEEDIDDCMLVSIDLTNQKRPIGKKIHNMQVVIDSDEEELVETINQKSCSDVSNSLVVESVPKIQSNPENKSDVSNPLVDERVPMILGNPENKSDSNPENKSDVSNPLIDESVCKIQSNPENKSDVSNPLVDESVRKIRSNPENKSLSYNSETTCRTDKGLIEMASAVTEPVEKDENIEIYIDKDVKEERPFLDVQLQFLQSGPEVNTSEWLQEEKNINSVPHSSQYSMLKAARENLASLLAKKTKGVSPSFKKLQERSTISTTSSCEIKKSGPSKSKDVSYNHSGPATMERALPCSLTISKECQSKIVPESTVADNTRTCSDAPEICSNVKKAAHRVVLNQHFKQTSSNAPSATLLSETNKESHLVEIKSEPIADTIDHKSSENQLITKDATEKQTQHGQTSGLGPLAISVTQNNENRPSNHSTNEQSCLKCKRSFASYVLLQEHIESNFACEVSDASKLVQHKSDRIGSLACSSCAYTATNIHSKFEHVNNRNQCLKAYSSRCICCNIKIDCANTEDHLEQSQACKLRYMQLFSAEPKPSLDQQKTKQNTGLLLMSAGLATLSSINPAASCTVRCEGCSSWFSNYARFRLHIRMNHDCKQLYEDRYSHKRDSTVATEEKVSSATNKPKIFCPICAKKFATNAMLTIHLNENTSCRSKFLKSSEPKIAKRTSDFRRSEKHTQNINRPVGNEILQSADLKKAVVKLSPKSVMCKCCHKPFFDACALSEHLLHSSKCNVYSTGLSVQCKGCKKLFVGDKGLAKHIQKSFICQAKLDSMASTCSSKSPSSKMSDPVLMASNAPSLKHSPKTQNVRLLQIHDLDNQQSNQKLPEVIKSLDSLETSIDNPASDLHKPATSLRYEDELDEIANEFSSDSCDGENSSSTSSDEADVEFKCKTCDKTFTEKALFKQHMKQHRERLAEGSKLAKQTIKCDACRRKLKSLKAFQAHLLKKSFCFLKVAKRHWYKNPGELMSCKVCSKIFKSVKDLGKHCFKNMTCRLCYVDQVLEPLKFPSQSPSALESIGTKNDPSPVMKSGCTNETSSSGQRLELPPVSLDKDLNRSPDVTKEQKISPSLLFECECCHAKFNSRYKFQLHFFNYKPDCLEFYATLEPQFQMQVPYCFRCKQRFVSIHKLRTHKCIGFRRYIHTCSHCNFRFSCLADLEAHAQNNENCIKALEKEDKAKQVDKMFLSQVNNGTGLRHASPQPDIGKPQDLHPPLYSQKGKKSVAKKSTAAAAKKIARVKEKLPPSASLDLVSCQMCFKKFPTLPLLLEHSYEHTEEKQYDCKRCSFVCYHYNRFVSHEAVHERLDKQCEHFKDRLDLHSTVVKQNVITNTEKSTSGENVPSQEPYMPNTSENLTKTKCKNTCKVCKKDFDSEKNLKKHLACSVHCKSKSLSPFTLKSESHKESEANRGGLEQNKNCVKVMQKTATISAYPLQKPDQTLHDVRPSVKIVTKVGDSGKRFLAASPVQQAPKNEHLYCFWCRLFLKSKEDVERHSVYKRHTLLSRKTLGKAVWFPGKYSCKICNRKMLVKNSLVRHMVNKHQEASSLLENLGPSFTDKQQHRREVQDVKHLKKAKLHCSLCKKNICSKSKTSHFLVHLSSLRTETRRSSTVPMKRPSKETCKICEIVLGSRSGLLRHLDRHREEDIYTLLSKSSPLTDKTTNAKTFPLSCVSTNGSRLKRRSTPGKCKLCQKKFLNISTFMQHFKMSHSIKYSNFKPPICYYAKDAQTSLKSVKIIGPEKHLAHKVTSEKPLMSPEKCKSRLKRRSTPGKCKLCQKKFLNISKFMQHFKMSHSIKYSNFKPPICYYAKDAQTSSKSLKIIGPEKHLAQKVTSVKRLTSSEKCKSTPKKIQQHFKVSPSLLGQKVELPLRHAGKEAQKAAQHKHKRLTYVCKVCNSSFKKIRYLKIHIKKWHQNILPDSIRSSFMNYNQGKITCTICQSKFKSEKCFDVHYSICHWKQDPALNKIVSLCAVVTDAEQIKDKPLKGDIELGLEANICDFGAESQPGFSFGKKRVLRCGLCNCRIRAVLYGKHLMMSHNLLQGSLHACEYCRVDFPNREDLDQHRSQCKQDCCCHLCGKQFGSLQGLRNHIMHFHNRPWKRYVAKLITRDGQTMKPFNSPQSTASRLPITGKPSGKEKQLPLQVNEARKCNICKSTFDRASVYLEHMQTHLMSCKVYLGGETENISYEDDAAVGDSNEYCGQVTAVKNFALSEDLSNCMDDEFDKNDIMENKENEHVIDGIDSSPSKTHFSGQSSDIYDPETGQIYSNSEVQELMSDLIVGPDLLKLVKNEDGTNGFPLASEFSSEKAKNSADTYFNSRESFSYVSEKDVMPKSKGLETRIPSPKRVAMTGPATSHSILPETVRDTSESEPVADQEVCVERRIAQALEKDVHSPEEMEIPSLISVTKTGSTTGHPGLLKAVSDVRESVLGPDQLNQEICRNGRIAHASGTDINPQSKGLPVENKISNSKSVTATEPSTSLPTIPEAVNYFQKSEPVKDRLTQEILTKEPALIVSSEAFPSFSLCRGLKRKADPAENNVCMSSDKRSRAEDGNVVQLLSTVGDLPTMRSSVSPAVVNTIKEATFENKSAPCILSEGNDENDRMSPENTSEDVPTCSAEAQLLAFSSKESDRVHGVCIKTEKPDPEAKSANRNLFAFFNDSIDLNDVDEDGLEFIAYDPPTLSDFIESRSPAHASPEIPTSSNDPRDSNSLVQSSISTPQEILASDHVSSSTNPSDNLRNVFDMLSK
ncbi:Zinc finger protein 26 [Plakobranchus ocellatus]|uniref:Zinc finger protein 26 n=1 Tax=Plakobranchus ocellatus TaxID=259542 RepID=A0AAV4B9B3_9GAST|nr:Zinc finger protein 26 [Plakobranchus ocellatus]